MDRAVKMFVIGLLVGVIPGAFLAFVFNREKDELEETVIRWEVKNHMQVLPTRVRIEDMMPIRLKPGATITPEERESAPQEANEIERKVRERMNRR